MDTTERRQADSQFRQLSGRLLQLQDDEPAPHRARAS